jgi:hypothetical protein
VLYTDFEGQRIKCISDCADQHPEVPYYVWFKDAYSGEPFKRSPWSWRFGVGGWPVKSKVLICPFCFEVWARCSFAPDDFHTPVAVQCSNCEFSYKHESQVPGSILDDSFCNGIDWGLLARLPEALLRREFELTLKAFK